MSSVARKSGNRTVMLRDREEPSLTVSRHVPANSIGLLFDDDVPIDPKMVFLPVTDVEVFMDKMERCVEEARLTKMGHQFLDGGVLIQFRSKQDADVFRRVMAE